MLNRSPLSWRARADRPSAFEGLDQLDVSGCHGECGHGGLQSLVGGEHARLESDSEREVQRIIDRSVGGVREFVGVYSQHTARNGFQGSAADVIHESAAVFGSQLTAADLLPNRIGGLRQER